VDRLSVWQMKRDARIAAERAEREKQALTECTFRPHIDSEPPSAASTPLPDSASQHSQAPSQQQDGGATPRAYGFEKFVERQRDGRQRRAQRQDVPHVTGAFLLSYLVYVSSSFRILFVCPPPCVAVSFPSLHLLG
jgi:hypothetical protein